jgi:uncharacterized protein YbaP (TraB family)
MADGRKCVNAAPQHSLALYPGGGKGLRMAARIARLVAAVALAFAAPACAADAAASAPAPSSGPALWKVADADTTIYLFGTIHALPPGIHWFGGRVAQAFDSSGELVTEIDPAEAADVQGQIMAMATLPPGQSLRAMMKPEDRAEYETALASLGLPADALDRFEPWYATINLAMLPLLKDGYGPDSGVEYVLTDKAANKQRDALETVQFQIGLFDAMPMDKQLEYLDETVEGIPELSGMLAQMVADWLAGDADALAVLMNDEMQDAAIYDRLLVARNIKWAEWIDRRLKQPGAVFIAVGAGHLAGRGSVQEQLKARGITVTRIE